MKKIVLYILLGASLLTACSNNQNTDEVESQLSEYQEMSEVNNEVITESSEEITPEYDDMFDTEDTSDGGVIIDGDEITIIIDREDIINDSNPPILYGGHTVNVKEFIGKPLNLLTADGAKISGHDGWDGVFEFSAYNPNINVIFHFQLDGNIEKTLDSADIWDTDEEMFANNIIIDIRAKYYDNSELDAYEGLTVEVLTKNGFNITGYARSGDEYELYANIGDIGDVIIILEDSAQSAWEDFDYLTDEEEEVFAKYKAISIEYDLIRTSHRGYR